MFDMSLLQYFSMTFTCSSKVTLPNIRNGLVKALSDSHCFDGSLSKPLSSLNVNVFPTLHVEN